MHRPSLFNLAAALSLLACPATLALWARSYDVTDRFDHGDGQAESGLVSQWGELALYRRHLPAPIDPPRHWSHAVGPPRPIPYDLNTPTAPPPRFRSPVRLYNFHSATGDHVQALVLAHWLLAAAAAPLPLAWLLARRRARRRRTRAAAGLCPACGYDLRATPGRCPECGTAVGH